MSLEQEELHIIHQRMHKEMHHIIVCHVQYSFSNRHESSLYSTFEEMFGKKPVLPLDLDDKQPRPDLDISVDM